MMSGTPIGGLLLDAGQGWRFSVRDGGIAGKLEGQPGILRVTTLAPNQFPQPVTHEHCLKLALDWVGAVNDGDATDTAGDGPPKLFDRQLMESATGPFGAASFRRGKDDVTVWYCTRPAGLILGAYACPTSFGRTAEARVIRARCAKMVGSAVFDRATWGADDALTKFVTGAFAAGPLQAPRPPRSRVIAPPPAPPATTTASTDTDPPRKPAPPKRRRS